MTSIVSGFPVQNLDIKKTLPIPEDFSKALYTMDTGQNDLHDGFTASSMTAEQVQKSVPNMIIQFSQAIEVLKTDFLHFNISSKYDFTMNLN